MTKVLLLGSGPGVLACRGWPRAPFDRIVAINNAWRARPDWDDLVVPFDFPCERLPTALSPGQAVIGEAAFLPAMNAFGGVVYCGATMAFTAAYWVLAAHHPRLIAFLGCDMIYAAQGPTHFYGRGTPDPLRNDITLQSLEAKSARLMVLAARAGCAVVNLSDGDSRQVFPRATPATLPDRPGRFDPSAALAREAALGYRLPGGRGWNDPARFDPEALAGIDALWLAAAGPAQAARRAATPPTGMDNRFSPRNSRALTGRGRRCASPPST